MTIDVSQCSSENIKAGKFRKELPEIYRLKEVIENGAWHENQDVFTHTMTVLEQFELLLSRKRLNQTVKKYLKERVGNHARKDLLTISVLLHDIAKPVTATKDETGVVRCPGHEFMGSSMVGLFSSRFGLNQKDGDFVKRIVFCHGLIVEMENLIMAKGNTSFYRDSYKMVVGDIYYGLLLVFYADLLGSDLKRLNPREFKIRERLTASFIRNL